MNKILSVSFLLMILLVSCTTAKRSANDTVLEGSWELTYITGPKIAFEGLFPGQKPTLTFNLKENTVSGHNSCNKYFGPLHREGTNINFKDAKNGMTMMACQGTGDSTYMEALSKIESYTVSGDGKELHLLIGKVVMMRFKRTK